GRECCGKQHRQQSLVPIRVIVALRAAWAHSKRQRFGTPISRFLFPASVGSKNVAREKGKTAPRVRCTARAGLTLLRKSLQRERAPKRRRTPSGFVKTVQNRSTSIQFILRSNCSKCFPSPELMEIGYRVF